MKVMIALVVVIVAVLWYLGWQTEHQPEPVTPAGAPVATPVVRSGGGSQQVANRQTEFAQQAKAMNVELREYKPEAQGAVITIAWKGDIATIGGDYLQACITAGLMRDFELPGDQAISMEKGQRIWLARYRVIF
jgi:hypothetical protein